MVKRLIHNFNKDWEEISIREILLEAPNKDVVLMLVRLEYVA